jgi:hypothetical protein
MARPLLSCSNGSARCPLRPCRSPVHVPRHGRPTTSSSQRSVQASARCGNRKRPSAGLTRKAPLAPLAEGRSGWFSIPANFRDRLEGLIDVAYWDHPCRNTARQVPAPQGLPVGASDLAAEGIGKGLGMGKAIEITRLDRSARELRELAVRIEDGDVVRRLLGMAVCDAITQTIITLPEQLRRSLAWDQGAELA